MTASAHRCLRSGCHQCLRMAEPIRRAAPGRPAPCRGGCPFAQLISSRTRAGLGSQTPSRAFAAESRIRMAGLVIFPITGDTAAPLTATASNNVIPAAVW